MRTSSQTMRSPGVALSPGDAPEVARVLVEAGCPRVRRSSRWLAASLGMALLLLLWATPGAAQRGSISGMVRDTIGAPISGVHVTLVELGRSVQAGNDGRFSFTDLPADDYTLRFRRIGFQTLLIAVSVAPGEAVNGHVEMEVVGHMLDPVIVRGTNTRVTGVVGDASWRPIAGATVYLAGLGQQTTDEEGRFTFDDIEEGSHSIWVDAKGYLPISRAVFVPHESTREFVLIMRAGRRPTGAITAWQEFDRRRRMAGSGTALVSREELAAHQGSTLDAALPYAFDISRQGMGDLLHEACIILNGERQLVGWDLRAFRVEEVEAVEVYAPGSDHSRTLSGRLRSSECSGRQGPLDPTSARVRRTLRTGAIVVVWTR